LIPDPAIKKIIGDTLLNWHDDPGSGIGRVVVPNVKTRERFLPPSQMKEILLAVYAASNQDVAAVAKAYEAECQNNVLRGEPIGVRPAKHPPVLVGRAVERSRLFSFLDRYYGPTSVEPSPFFPFFLDHSDIDHFIEGILHGLIGQDEEALLSSPFGVWVTWRDDSTDGPFSWAAQNTPDELRAGLGLDPQQSGELLLFEYAASGVNLVRPTVADAGLFPFFEPPDPDHEWYGRTRPWPEAFAKQRQPPVLLSPVSHPEAVHERLTFAAVNLPARSV
jgi:hypothetical protein